jgi:hypothetical protein
MKIITIREDANPRYLLCLKKDGEEIFVVLNSSRQIHRLNQDFYILDETGFNPIILIEQAVVRPATIGELNGMNSSWDAHGIEKPRRPRCKSELR